jgi:hypothetical protein
MYSQLYFLADPADLSRRAIPAREPEPHTVQKECSQRANPTPTFPRSEHMHARTVLS